MTRCPVCNALVSYYGRHYEWCEHYKPASPDQAKGGDAVVEPDFGRLLEEIADWALVTFPKATPTSWVKHLTKEVKELSDDPTDVREMADCVILVSGLAKKTGNNLYEAVRAKFEVNKARRWGEPDSEGVVEHVRTEAEQTGDSVKQATCDLGEAESIRVALKHLLAAKRSMAANPMRFHEAFAAINRAEKRLLKAVRDQETGEK